METKKFNSFFAFALALTYIIGFLCLIFVFHGFDTNSNIIEDKIQYLIKHKANLQAWYFFIYIVFGFLLIPLNIQLKEQFKTENLVIKTFPILGFIWSGLVISSGMIFIVGTEFLAKTSLEVQQLVPIWTVLEILIEAFGGGVEIVGGLWCLLISVSGIRQKKINKTINYIGLLVGVSGIITIIPILKDFGAIFGLGQIVWFILLGIWFYRK